MAPLTTFIATIKGWHVIAVFALTLLFIVVGSTPGKTRFQDTLLASIGIPVMLFFLAFLGFALPNRKFGAAELFPSLLLVISAFVAVGITGAMLDDRKFPPALAITMGAIVSLLMSGLLVGWRSLFPKMFGMD